MPSAILTKNDVCVPVRVKSPSAYEDGVFDHHDGVRLVTMSAPIDLDNPFVEDIKLYDDNVEVKVDVDGGVHTLVIPKHNIATYVH
jgi:hypothetical protein